MSERSKDHQPVFNKYINSFGELLHPLTLPQHKSIRKNTPSSELYFLFFLYIFIFSVKLKTVLSFFFSWCPEHGCAVPQPHVTEEKQTGL